MCESVKDHISKEAEAVLIEEFHNGELKGGDRQSCFQMEQSLRIKFSSNVANWVDRYSIQSWLSTGEKKRMTLCTVSVGSKEKTGNIYNDENSSSRSSRSSRTSRSSSSSRSRSAVVE